MSRDAAATLGYLLTRGSTLLRAKVAVRMEPLGLTLPEFICMQILGTRPGLSNSEVARYAQVTRQAMNAVLHRLEEVGYITRPTSADHGRSLPAQLTRRGWAQLERARAALQIAEDEFTEQLSPDETETMRALLVKCVSDIEL